jgi:hypothetical protein
VQDFLRGRYPSFSYQIPSLPPSRSNALLKFPAEILPIWNIPEIGIKNFGIFSAGGLDFLNLNLYIIQVLVMMVVIIGYTLKIFLDTP